MAIATQENFKNYPSNEVLVKIRQIAETGGREVQTVLDEALKEYIERKTKGRPSQQVMNAFAESLAEFDSLYPELAK